MTTAIMTTMVIVLLLAAWALTVVVDSWPYDE